MAAEERQHEEWNAVMVAIAGATTLADCELFEEFAVSSPQIFAENADQKLSRELTRKAANSIHYSVGSSKTTHELPALTLDLSSRELENLKSRLIAPAASTT